MAEALGELADAMQQAGGAVAAALASATGGWLVLGLALHLANQVARGRGWWAIVRVAHGGRTRVRRRQAIAAWVAGAGAAGVLPPPRASNPARRRVKC